MKNLCTAAVVAAGLFGTNALAALGGSTGVVIPYAGHLDFDGAPVNGPVDFRFDVHTNANGTACAVASGGNALQVLDVAVTDGQFALEIRNVPEACVTGADVHIVIAVRTAGGGFVTIGKQRVVPVLSALTSGAGDFAVAATATAAVSTATTVRATTEVQTPKIVVTGPNNVVSSDLAVHRTADGTRALSIRAQSIEATGTAANQDITLTPRGTGALRVAGKVALWGTPQTSTVTCSSTATCPSVTGAATTDGLLSISYFSTIRSNNNLEVDPTRYCATEFLGAGQFQMSTAIGGSMLVPVRSGDSWSIKSTPRNAVNDCSLTVILTPLGVP